MQAHGAVATVLRQGPTPGHCENAMPSIGVPPADRVACLITDAMWVAGVIYLNESGRTGLLKVLSVHRDVPIPPVSV